MLSNRIQQLEESGIRKVFNLAANNTGEYVNFSIGQPHFPLPDELKDAECEAVRNNHNAYTTTMGIPGLREKIAKKLNTQNGINASMEDVIITTGVSGSIFLLFSSILNPEDEIIIPDPYFVLYKQIVNFLGAKMIPLDTYSDFQLDPEKIKNRITPKTKAIFINPANNPTGAVYSKEVLEEIANIAEQYNLLIISDEIYEKFDYDNKFFSIGSIYKNTVTFNGFSKSHAVTGWRLGYAHGPKEIISAMNKLQQYTFVCAPAPFQFAMEKCFDLDMSQYFLDYKNKRDYLYDNLKDKYDFNKPEGAFYAFMKIPEGRDNFVEELIDKKLLVVPGKVFSARDDYFRVSFAVSDENLEKGVNILKNI